MMVSEWEQDARDFEDTVDFEDYTGEEIEEILQQLARAKDACRAATPDTIQAAQSALRAAQDRYEIMVANAGMSDEGEVE